VKTIKAAGTTQVASDDKTADDGDVMRLTRQIMVEYRETLEALAKSEAEDRATAKPANSK
jgi:hypothetical protein